MPKFTITGPDTDIGLTGPSANPVFNQGTLRLAPQGESRKIQCDLLVDLDDESKPLVYVPPIDSFVIFTATDLEGNVVVPPTPFRGPGSNKELSAGQRVFEAHRYGFVGVLFPSSLTPPGTEKTFIFKWSIDPKVGEGEKMVVVSIDGEDLWLPDVVTWLP